MGRPADTWRWIERDPFGRRIFCSEEKWAAKVEFRDGLEAHEDSLRSTLRDPDQVYFDPGSTAATRERSGGNPEAQVLHYVSAGRTHGHQQGNLVVVVVKFVPDPSTGETVGFVLSMLLPNRLSRRLQLRWERGRSP
jgi:hypothetical protein